MNRKKRNLYLIIFVLLVGISLGYAYLNTNLNILGTSLINNATWDIYWNNLNVTDGSVTGSQVNTPAYIKTGATEVEYAVTLNIPGEYYEFTVDAVNNGSIDAMIESFSNKVYQSNGITEREMPSYANYTVTYADGTPVAVNQLLAANSTETYKVRIEFKTDINASDLPSTNDSMIFKFKVTYVQANGNAISTAPITNLYYAEEMYDSSFASVEIHRGDNISTLQSTLTGTFYNTLEAATTANPTVRHVLRLDIQKNKVVGYSLAFVNNNTPLIITNNVPAYLRAGDTSQAVFDQNSASLLSFFGSQYCGTHESLLNCTYELYDSEDFCYFRMYASLEDYGTVFIEYGDYAAFEYWYCMLDMTTAWCGRGG